MTDMTLADALAEIQDDITGPTYDPDTFIQDGWSERQSHTIATILNAAASGELVPATEADLAALVESGGWAELVFDAIQEAEKAMRKFPQPNYVISKFSEEAGEVVKAAIHCAESRESAKNLRGEMKQAIAMLYRLWVEGDQVHGLPPVYAALAAAKGGV